MLNETGDVNDVVVFEVDLSQVRKIGQLRWNLLETVCLRLNQPQILQFGKLMRDFAQGIVRYVQLFKFFPFADEIGKVVEFIFSQIDETQVWPYGSLHIVDLLLILFTEHNFHIISLQIKLPQSVQLFHAQRQAGNFIVLHDKLLKIVVFAEIRNLVDFV